MKSFGTFLFVFFCFSAHAQTASSADGVRPLGRATPADFGLSYSLSQDWVRATDLMWNRITSKDSLRGFDLLLAAVYVPKSTMSGSNPFFTLLSPQQPSTDCKGYLEANINQTKGQKGVKIEGGVEEFSAAGHDYYRIIFENSVGPHHRSVICTTANHRVLLWNASAENAKGLDAVISTLDSVAPLAPSPAGPTAKPNDSEHDSPEPASGEPRRKVPAGVTTGLLVKKVNPFYPPAARSARIQGTVVLEAEISKKGTIVNLELIEGPIELAGSAVDAVRQWRYRPYMLNGEPVDIRTQIMVNYELRPY
jgi:TonB family protein